MENATLLKSIDGLVTIDEFGTFESINPSACLKQYAAHREELVENFTQSLNDSIRDLQLLKAKVSLSLEKELCRLQKTVFFRWLHMNSGRLRKNIK